MDAVDIALVDLSDGAPRLVESNTTPWPPTLRERLSTVAAGGPLTITTLAMLDADVGAFIASAINQLTEHNPSVAQGILAAGCHGQTVAHSPQGSPATTVQLGDANVIAEHTGITTINDFRRRDMAAGGQGAPLAPAFHDAILRSAGEARVVLNLGGIANITVLPQDPAQAVIGLDTGPANCLMDGWCRQHLGMPYDDKGEWAASATADQHLLETMMADPYFAMAAPKSTGTQYFSSGWLRQQLSKVDRQAPAVVQATLLALSCRTIAAAIATHAPETDRVLVCGGGSKNDTLLNDLREQLQLPVESTGDHGIDPQWVEAMAFAWLAKRTLDGLPGNLPAVTGARGPRILGAIHPA